MSSGHVRKASTRAPLPRRTTKGPLDADDPLSDSLSPATPTSPTAGSLKSPLGLSPSIQPIDQNLQDDSSLLSGSQVEENEVARAKDLSFLLDTSIFHPLSNIDTPPPFRKPLAAVPEPGSDLKDVAARIDTLLSQFDYLGAATIAALCLTSGMVSPTDFGTIFQLLAVRFSCLELSGNVLLAAQEAKALEDLMSGFYYIEQPASSDAADAKHGQHLVPKHIMPFSLRIQAMRLQNIGFSDPRRGVAALYDLGLECREHIASPYSSDVERAEWTARLDELSIRVVNSLIELGDLDCASRTLEQMKPAGGPKNSTWAFRAMLLYIKLGQLANARRLLTETEMEDSDKSLISSLLALADGNLEEVSRVLSEQSSSRESNGLAVLAKQNLAVTYLYAGKIAEARHLMEELVDAGFSFQSLTINLATVYDLTSDKSRDMKLALANQVASSSSTKKAFTNADFKL